MTPGESTFPWPDTLIVVSIQPLASTARLPKTTAAVAPPPGGPVRPARRSAVSVLLAAQTCAGLALAVSPLIQGGAPDDPSPSLVDDRRHDRVPAGHYVGDPLRRRRCIFGR